MRTLCVSTSAEKKLAVFVRKHPILRPKLKKVIDALLRNPFITSLDTHKLTGMLKDFYGASISYEYRIVFFFDEKHIYLVNIGSHDEVY